MKEEYLEIMTEKLKPCPFCGSEARLMRNQTAFYILCCECSAQSLWDIHKEQAIEAWNRRADDD